MSPGGHYELILDSLHGARNPWKIRIQEDGKTVASERVGVNAGIERVIRKFLDNYYKRRPGITGEKRGGSFRLFDDLGL